MAQYLGNITESGARRRRLTGIIALGLAVTLLVLLEEFGAPRGSRLVLFLPFWIGAVGLLQAHEKTCIALGVAGRREVNGTGTCALPADERGAVTRRTIKIAAESLVLAVIATVFAWAM